MKKIGFISVFENWLNNICYKDDENNHIKKIQRIKEIIQNIALNFSNTFYFFLCKKKVSLMKNKNPKEVSKCLFCKKQKIIEKTICLMDSVLDILQLLSEKRTKANELDFYRKIEYFFLKKCDFIKALREVKRQEIKEFIQNLQDIFNKCDFFIQNNKKYKLKQFFNNYFILNAKSIEKEDIEKLKFKFFNYVLDKPEEFFIFIYFYFIEYFTKNEHYRDLSFFLFKIFKRYKELDKTDENKYLEKIIFSVFYKVKYFKKDNVNDLLLGKIECFYEKEKIMENIKDFIIPIFMQIIKFTKDENEIIFYMHHMILFLEKIKERYLIIYKEKKKVSLTKKISNFETEMEKVIQFIVSKQSKFCSLEKRLEESVKYCPKNIVFFKFPNNIEIKCYKFLLYKV